MKKLEYTVKENEEKIIPYVWINGEDKEVLVDVHLLGNNSTAKIIGIFLGTGNSEITFNTNVIHKGKKTVSRTELRGVFQQKAAFKNDGMVHIAKGATGADGYFTSKILLFDDAKGRSVPSLEIDENDLKAGHASTVGRPDAEQMFYLRSRGLNEKEAEQLLIQGFFEPLLRDFNHTEQTEIRVKLLHALQ